MRPIPVLLAVAAVAGGIEMMGPVPADAQCSAFSRYPGVPKVRTRYVDSRNAE